ncbi:helix-turn-helix transcriptional regulator [Neobacillus sp. WH10]|uniref:helix-turn-helix domain-containing protein n=1 Tax=Neobacillus sp. WH10 TaxID=3047873 RepID=UPI0024C18710|nr:helix-turn-helix transcriptional regulator [Neobacillus sp. WH10]WHY77357.1 helix-turn-helix transcriptional regulator [Neobacillus sp. WH10]
MNHKIQIGEVLKKIRKAKRITQWKLAHDISINPTSLSKLERNICEPSLETIFLIASGLDMKASEFVKEIEENLELSRKHE